MLLQKNHLLLVKMQVMLVVTIYLVQQAYQLELRLKN
jgi:hypothetical protein